MAFTFFFRDIQTLDTIAKHFLPYVSGRSSIRVWDAGCAMGPEPYSMTIILAEKMSKYLFNNLRVYASDYELEFKKIIEEGVYSRTETERIPEEIFAKYFVKDEKPDHFRVIDSIREKLIFQHHDLLTLTPIGDGFSLILCKNVLLHFQQSERIEVIKMFHKSLAPGGLFATEHTQKMPEELLNIFELISPEAQLYRKI